MAKNEAKKNEQTTSVEEKEQNVNNAETVVTPAEETKPDGEAAVVDAADANKLDDVEAPADAEEITDNEALILASEEVNRLRAELEESEEKCKAAEDVIKLLEEEKKTLEEEKKTLEEKCSNCENKGAAIGDDASYIELLNSFEAKIDSYSDIRRERLRREFVTDLKEEIQRQRDLLTNA